MDKSRTVGVDLAKNVFHLVACDAQGREVGRKRLRRGQRLAYFAQRSPCVVGMEACASALGDGAQYRRGRDATALGLVPRQHSSGGHTLQPT